MAVPVTLIRQQNPLPEPLSAYVTNDESYQVTIRQADNTPYSLSAATEIEFYLKIDETQLDSAPKAKYTLSGGQIVVNNAPGGVLTVTTLGTDLAPPGRYTWHLDVLVSAKRDTVGFGPFTILDT